METFDSFSKMPPIPNMTPEKWNSLSELQREEIISDYNARKEGDAFVRKLRDKEKYFLVFHIHWIEEENVVMKTLKMMMSIKWLNRIDCRDNYKSKKSKSSYNDDFIVSDDNSIE